MKAHSIVVAFVTVATLASWIVLPANAQRRSTTSEVVDVTLIEVPVNVVDRNGNPVRGLRAENFELFDEGKRQVISNFEAVDLTTLTFAPDATPASIPPAARRNFVVLFDLTNSTPSALLRSRTAAKEFLHQSLQPVDLAAVGLISVEDGLRLLTNFTADRDLLVKAIDTLGNPRFFRTYDPLLFADARASAQAGAREREPVGPGGIGGDDEAAMHVLEMLDASERLNDQQRRDRVERQIVHFAAAARVLDATRGRKQIILLSEGFDARLIHGREALGSEEQRRESDAILSGEIWSVDNEKRFGSAEATNRLSQMAEFFKRSDVTLHAIDIQGLRAGSDVRDGARTGSNEGLHLLAGSTGGRVFQNANDLSESFGRLIAQQDVVYILGFSAASSGSPGKFHNLRVRLRDVPGGRVMHRAGYYESADAGSALEQTLATGSLLMSDSPRGPIRTNVLAIPFAARSADPQVPVIVEIDGPSLIGEQAAEPLNGEIFVYAFDQSSRVADFHFERITLDLAKVGETVRRSGIKYYAAMDLPPGTYAIRTLVRVAGSNRFGAKHTELTVPDFSAPVVLSPLALAGDDGSILVRAAARRDAETVYPFTLGTESFVPAALPRFVAGGAHEVALFFYNLAPEGLQISARVDGNGVARTANVALAGRAPAAEGEPSKLLFQFMPEDLATGEYRLVFTVRGGAGAEAHTSTLPFVINGRE